jgi:hypothetical protein
VSQSATIRRSSNEVTLSALLHSATRPAAVAARSETYSKQA